MIYARMRNRTRVWEARTPSGETRLFNFRHEAMDWLMRHSCEKFVPGPWYSDMCATCGGHVSMHEDETA